MKRQIIAKINIIANQLDTNGLYAEANSLTNIMRKLAFDRDFDEEGTHDEMFGPMNDDPDKSGKIIVSYTADKHNPYQSRYTIYVFIDDEAVEEINSYEDENGKHFLHDLDKANQMAREIPSQHPNVDFEMHLLQKTRPNPRIPGDFERD
jgi:hypothetical protein